MIPQGGSLTADNSVTDSISEEMPGLTYYMDWKNRRINGYVDQVESVKQAALKILLTERYEHIIYSSDYGTEWSSVLGKGRLWVQSELKRVITEALLQDDRILEITDFSLFWRGNDVTANFTVVTPYGTFEMSREVNGRVRGADL